MPQDPYADAINTALNAAPNLVNYPSLAMAAASDPQPDLAAQAIAFAQQQQAMQQAANNTLQAQGAAAQVQARASKGFNPFGDFMHVLGAPAREVSHLYRYTREAFHTHGIWGGLAVLLPSAVGGTIGTALLPGLGTTLGAEIGAEASRAIGGNEKAYDASEKGATFQIDGKAVSPGRDLARVFGMKNTDAGFGKVLSGFGDAAFDVGTDPLNVVGKVEGARKSLNGFSSIKLFGQRLEVKNSFLQRIAPGMEISSPERLDQAVAAYGSVRRAFGRLAQLDAGGVVHEFPELAPFAKELGSTRSFDDVHEWFRQVTIDHNLQDRLLGTALPSLSLFRPVTNKLRDAMQVEDITKANPLVKAPAKVWKTLTGQQPFNIDQLGNISGSFKPDDVNALKGVYQTMRFSMGTKAARRWTTAFADADTLAEKKAIWANAMDEMLKTAGFPKGVDEFNKVTARARGFATGDGLERFGAGRDRGDLVNEVVDADGNLVGRYALYQHQNGELAFPSFRAVKSALRDISVWKKAFGSLDDFVASAYTDKIFKPLAVMSLGFGVRDALSETIPGMMQHGTFNMLRGMVGGQAAKLEYTLSNAATRNAQRATMRAAGTAAVSGDESHHVIAVMSKLAGGASKLLGKSKDWQEDAAWLTLHNNGHIATGAAAAGHGLAAFGTQDPVGQFEDLLQEAGRRNVGRLGKQAGHPAYHGTGEYKLFGPTDNVYPDYWISGLQKRALEPSGQAIAKDLRDAHLQGAGLDDENVISQLVGKERQRIENGEYKVNRSSSQYVGEDESKLLSRHGIEDTAAFAAARVDDMRNYVMGRDGAVHQNLIEKLAAGEKPTHADIKDVSVDSMPDRLVGEDLHPILPKNAYDRLLQVGFKKLVEPWSSFLSRQPIYLNQFREEKAILQKYVDKGIFTDEQAKELAVQRAAVNIIPQVQIPEIRSQFAVLVRNIMPFYYAQEQAIRRAVTLVKKNPEAVAKYAWANYFMTNPAWMHTDDTGNRYVAVPGSGLFGHLLQGAISPLVGMPVVQGLPLSYNGTVESFKNAMPYSALMNQGTGFGLSPIVSLGLNWLANRDPSFAPIVKGALGNISYQQNWYNTFIPSTTLRAVVTGMTAPDRDRAFANAQLSALQAAYYHDKFPKAHADGTPPSSAELQKFQDEIKNNARNAFFAKAVIDFVSPIGGSPVLQDIGPDGKTFTQEFYDLLKSKGNIADATLEFMKEHGDKSISYTVSHSKNDMGVSVPSASKPAMDWIDSNRGLIDTYGAAAAFLIPQVEDTNGDINLIHQELLQMKVRHTDSPQEFADAIYTAVGNRQYFDKRDERDKLLEEYKGNKAATEAITSNWSQWEDQFKIQNPTWTNNFFTPKRSNDALRALSGLQKMAQNGDMPAGPQTTLVMQMVNNYYNQKAALAQLGGATMFDRQRKQIKANWSAYLDNVKKTQPLLSDALYSIFVPLENLA